MEFYSMTVIPHDGNVGHFVLVRRVVASSITNPNYLQLSAISELYQLPHHGALQIRSDAYNTQDSSLIIIGSSETI